MKRDLLSWAILIALAIIWGGSFTFTTLAAKDLPPITIAAARLAIGAALLLLIAALRHAPAAGAINRQAWLFALGGAFFSNAAPFTLLAWAQSGHVDSSLAAIFMATTPLVVLPLAAAFVPGERMTLTKTLGFTAGFVGVALLIGVEALGGLGGSWIQILAQCACILAASGYAIGSVLLRLAPAIDPIVLSARTLLLAAILAVPVAFLAEAPQDAAWTMRSTLAVLYLGVLPTALAMFLLLIVIRRRGPTFLSLVNFQVPVWGMIFGIVFLKETAPAQAPLALILILGGVAIAQGLHRPLLRRWRARS